MCARNQRLRIVTDVLLAETAGEVLNAKLFEHDLRARYFNLPLSRPRLEQLGRFGYARLSEDLDVAIEMLLVAAGDAA